MKPIAIIRIFIGLMLATVATVGTLSLASAQVEYENFATDFGTYDSTHVNVTWQITGSVGTDNAPTENPGSLLFDNMVTGTFPAHIVGNPLTIPSGSYILEFDWYYTGQPVTITLGGNAGTQTTCSRDGNAWAIDQWNSCTTQLTTSNLLGGVWFLSRSGALDMVSDLIYISTVPAPTPTPDPNVTPTPTPTATPVTTLCQTIISASGLWVQQDVQLGSSSTIAVVNDGFGGFHTTGTAHRASAGTPWEVNWNAPFDLSIVNGVGFDYSRSPSASYPLYIKWAVNGWGDYFRDDSDNPTISGRVIVQNSGVSIDTSSYDHVYGRGDADWNGTLSVLLSGVGWELDPITPDVSVSNVLLYLNDGTTCDLSDPTEPPIEEPPPSDYGVLCSLPALSGTETITTVISANLIDNGSFESGLDSWFTGDGDYGVIQTYPTDNWASDGSHVLSLPGTGAARLCQPFTVPTHTVGIDYFSGGFDTRSAGDGTGQHNIDLIFSSNITSQIANGFVYPSDTLTWTVNAAGQNLPSGAVGELCIVGDDGDVSAYVDRVYIHARDTLSDVLCIAPVAPIDPIPTLPESCPAIEGWTVGSFSGGQGTYIDIESENPSGFRINGNLVRDTDNSGHAFTINPLGFSPTLDIKAITYRLDEFSGGVSSEWINFYYIDDPYFQTAYTGTYAIHQPGWSLAANYDNAYVYSAGGTDVPWDIFFQHKITTTFPSQAVDFTLEVSDISLYLDDGTTCNYADLLPPPPPPPPPDDFPIIDIGADGGACYDCLSPENFLDIGQWIRWLLCGFNNLFYCYLYIWLLSIAGYISAIWQSIGTFFGWISSSIQATLSWVGGYAAAFFSWAGTSFSSIAAWGESVAYWLYSLLAGLFYEITNSVMGMVNSALASFTAGGAMIVEYAAAAWGLISLYFEMLKTFFAALVDILELIWRMATGVLSAFGSDSYTSVELLGYDMIGVQEPTGINDASLFYWLVMGFMLADTFIIINPVMRTMMYVVMGLMSYGVILWTLRRGSKMLPVS